MGSEHEAAANEQNVSTAKSIQSPQAGKDTKELGNVQNTRHDQLHIQGRGIPNWQLDERVV